MLSHNSVQLRSSLSPKIKKRFAGKSSAYSGLYRLSPAQRRSILTQHCGELHLLNHEEPNPENRPRSEKSEENKIAETFSATAVENSIGLMTIPLGVASHFLIEGVNFFVPMATEEPSVIAAASHGAKLARSGGGFQTASCPPVTTGQIQLSWRSWSEQHQRDIHNLLSDHQQDLLRQGQTLTRRLERRGGGARGLDWRFLPEIHSVVIHLHVATVDAMGANVVNSACEELSHFACKILPGAIMGLRILSNLSLGRMVEARCQIPASALSSEHHGDGVGIARAIERASLFAEHDIFRASTHNKGIMNGISAVALATANDTRALEAGCHSYAAMDGRYKPLATWRVHTAGGHEENREDNDDGEDGKDREKEVATTLKGHLKLPLATGVVGGMTRHHPIAQSTLKILGDPSAAELAEIMAATGLAQNLAALRALSTEGIQRGHMNLHHKKSSPSSSP